jgi:hypothetical protein
MIGGDFNVSPQDLALLMTKRQPRAFRVAGPGQPTCFTFQAATELDFFLVHPRITNILGKVKALGDHEIATHRPVVTELRRALAHQKVAVLQPNGGKPITIPMIGPRRDPGREWEKWRLENQDHREPLTSTSKSIATNDPRLEVLSTSLDKMLSSWLGVALQELRDITGSDSPTSIAYTTQDTCVSKLVKAPAPPPGRSGSNP